ncbi:metabolite traffic protein EboE [Roseimaritima sediminicola]|uniref:metabolite traffic protein EboE n=1 Tax=Roseimaritima sediminicola TaxID=2662066 RepID=UPI0012982D61|nr:metabolite traffic protein EboE [Roseimaritima sediminicola]
MISNQPPHSNAPWTIGYCTNVHAGTDLESIRDNLLRYAVPIRSLAQRERLPVGLWLPAEAAAQLCQEGEAERFADWLAEQRLEAYTLNGFPYDNFHQRIVKHRVYEPAWWSDQRREYTMQLATVLDRLLPAGRNGSISTLPIGWPGEAADAAAIDRAGENLRRVADHLHDIEQQSGRRIVLAIEPEPGCVLDRSSDVVAFFDRHLPNHPHRRYLTVCHDVCHSAVMFEDQQAALRAYAAAGLTVGKLQVSSAVEARWTIMSRGRRREAFAQLAQFAEDRYLHQTGRRDSQGGFELAEDLPPLIAAGPEAVGDEDWRVHFHVPIFLESFGNLGTTREAILECVRFLGSEDAPTFTGDVEVETYAWTVLPETMRRRGLAEDIAAELTWLRERLAQLSMIS